jgi:hypothetical protein
MFNVPDPGLDSGDAILYEFRLAGAFEVRCRYHSGLGETGAWAGMVAQVRVS